MRKYKFLNPATRWGKAGEPLGSTYYDPNRHPMQGNESLNVSADKAIIVLGTQRPDGTWEFRTAQYKDIPGRNHGLCEHEVIRDRRSPLYLRSMVARTIFDQSPVYQSRTQAIDSALKTYPDNAGVKVIVLATPYPAK